MLVINTRRIIGYSTVNIARARDWFDFIPIIPKLNNDRYMFAIVYWTIMIIMHLICMFLICHSWYLFLQTSNQGSVVISVTIFWSSQRITKISISKTNLHLHWEIHDSCYIWSAKKNSASTTGVRRLCWTRSYTVVNRQLQVNYVNTLLYPVSVRYFPSPRCGVLCIFIGDLTLKSALLLCTLLSTRKNHF